MNKTDIFRCAICGMEYDNEEKAFQCETNNGPAPARKFRCGNRVIIKKSQQLAMVINYCYCKPNQPGRKPHQLLYLLILPSKARTTATEEDLTAI